jgi:hypothetical protein
MFGVVQNFSKYRVQKQIWQFTEMSKIVIMLVLLIKYSI